MPKFKLTIPGLIIVFISLTCTNLNGQSNQRVLNLSLQEVVEIARDQSPQAILSQHRFRASYWQHRTYTAEFLPSLNLRGTLPDFNRSIIPVDQPDGTVSFSERNNINSLARLSLNQSIGLTGGQIYMSSELQRIDELDENSSFYRTTPVNI